MLPVFKLLIPSNKQQIYIFLFFQVPFGYLILRGYSKTKFQLYLAKDLLGHF